MPQKATHPVDLLRTLVWMTGLMDLAGVSTGYALAAKVSGKGTDRRMWMRYGNAQSAAAWASDRSPYVDRAEAIWPGSSRWLTNPVWKILSSEKFEQHDIDLGLWQLAPKIRSRFFEKDGDKFIKRRKALHLAVFVDFHRFADFDALVALVLLMAEAELARSPILREAAIENYEVLQPYFAQRPEYVNVYPYLFSRIDAVMPRWFFLDIRRRVDIRMRWDQEDWALNQSHPKLRFPDLMVQLEKGLEYNPRHISAISRLRRASLLQRYI